jgi:hypothetical protein
MISMLLAVAADPSNEDVQRALLIRAISVENELAHFPNF